MNDPVQQFRDALAARGIIAPTDLIDGRLHRCDAEGRGGRGDAAYLLHLDGIPAGGFENWRDGFGWQTWRVDIGRAMTPGEEAAHRERIRAAQAARSEEESRRHAEAAETASLLWAAAIPCIDHPYLKTKGIVLCADDDWKTDGNPGLTKAQEASHAVSGFLAVPVFGEGRVDGQTDFNDLHQAKGLPAVKEAIEAALDGTATEDPESEERAAFNDGGL